MIMTDVQKAIFEKIEKDFDTLWNLFCQYIPDVKEIVAINDRTKFGRKYTKKFKLLCDSQQGQITSPCLFD